MLSEPACGKQAAVLDSKQETRSTACLLSRDLDVHQISNISFQELATTFRVVDYQQPDLRCAADTMQWLPAGKREPWLQVAA